MVANGIKYLNQIASYLNVPPGKISFGDNHLPSQVIKNSTTSGYVNIIWNLLNEEHSELKGIDSLEQAEIKQWIEYVIIYGLQSDIQSPSQLLQDLNLVLSNRTYLVAHRLTIADLFLYYSLQDIMENLTILDKEKYIHVSRWFDHLQRSPKIRQSNGLVDFTTLYLARLAPSRH